MEPVRNLSDTSASKGPGSQTASADVQSISGTGMDRRIEKKRQPWKWVAAAVALLVVGYGGYSVVSDIGSGRALRVEANRIALSTVSTGIFEDFIPIRGRVTPLKTVFLDAIEGGRVERVLVEDGAIVEAGQLLVELSNSALQLDVTRNEALVTEQLNNMRTIELQLEQNRLGHKRNLADINYQITRLTRLVERQRSLVNSDVFSKANLEDAEDELAFQKALKEVTEESQATDARLQETQLKFLQETSSQLETNLQIARSNLASLNVRAPVDGKVSGFDVEVGQSIQRGGRLGQVDDPDNFKLSADIDEFYLGRVDIEQPASFERNGRTYQMRVSKIYPQVTGGQFQIDLVFTGEAPDAIRRGQTLQSKLTLGDSEEAVLIPNGAFYQDTGGNWIFVVNADGTEAVRRTVRLGRRNARFIEVLEGLEPGEQVVTSPYTSYRDMDRLKLN